MRALWRRTTTCALAVAAAMTMTTPAHADGAGSAKRWPAVLHVGEQLSPGSALESRNGRFQLVMLRGGNLVETSDDGQRQWTTGTAAPGSVARLLPGGGFVVDAPDGHRLWTARSGGRTTGQFLLAIWDGGSLVVTDPRGSVVWSNHLGSRCTNAATAHAVIVSITYQHLWACRHARLVYTTPVTTAATAKGRVTPTGTWHVYSKARDVNLVGPTWNDHVHYWMPYDGPYGLHDATWQRFPEGSPKYRTNGSHGCVHVPLPVMRRLYRWARIGTQVSVRP